MYLLTYHAALEPLLHVMLYLLYHHAYHHAYYTVLSLHLACKVTHCIYTLSTSDCLR
jgi:hypothetical protein